MFYPELWGSVVFEEMLKKLKNKKRLRETVTDYSPYVEGRNATAYNGPRLGELTAVDLPATPGTAQELAKSNILINLNIKKGAVYQVKNIENAQSNVDLMRHSAQNAAEALLNAEDSSIVTAIITDADKKTELQGATLSLDDILAARKALNTAGAPLVNRYMLINPEHESALYSIESFVSRDKIPNADALKEGVIGRILGFEVLLDNEMPKVTTAGVISAIASANTKNVTLFYQSLCLGFARQKNISTVSNTDVYQPASVLNSYYVYGLTTQEPSYAYSLRDKA